MENFDFWDITPRSLVIVNRRFGRKNCLHLQGKIVKTRNWHEAAVDGGDYGLIVCTIPNFAWSD
jgi:hypothetical protein